MTDVATQITLGQYMSRDTLAPLLKKKFFGGYQVALGACIINVSTWLFQKGAVLGRARLDRFDALIGLLSPVHGTEDDLASILQASAKESLDIFGRQPDRFHSFWWKTEFRDLDFADSDVLKTLSRKMVSLEEIVPALDYWLGMGVGFGATYPDLVQNMWVKTYETPDPMWAEARAHGLDIPEEQTLLPLGDMEHTVLLELACYVSDYCPELIERLRLNIT